MTTKLYLIQIIHGVDILLNVLFLLVCLYATIRIIRFDIFMITRREINYLILLLIALVFWPSKDVIQSLLL